VFIKDFLLEVQDVMNFEKVVEQLIRNKVHDLMIDELFDQTDASMKNKEH